MPGPVSGAESSKMSRPETHRRGTLVPRRGVRMEHSGPGAGGKGVSLHRQRSPQKLHGGGELDPVNE